MARVLVVMWLCSLLAACSPALNWRELRFDEAGVSQLFPCKPVRQQRSLVLSGAPQVLVLQVCDAAGATWALAHTRASDPGEVPKLLDALATAAHANVGALRGAPLAQAVPGSAGHAASGRYRLTGHAPDGRPVEVAVLLYARGTRAVQLTVLGSRLADDAVETFFSAARGDS